MEGKQRKAKVKKTVQIDPLDITESLGYKTYRKNGRNSWSKEDDEELRTLMNQVFVEIGYKNGIEDIKSIQESELACGKISWERIALEFKNSTRKPKDLRKRWTASLDPNLKKGKWAPEEDTLLMKAYEKHGPHWLNVAEEISGRTEDQCAKRYIEILGPSSEGRLRKWTLEEDLSLVSKVKLYGTRWRRISSELVSRPSLTCRNRWRKIITSVVRGRAPREIVEAVKEKQDIDLLNESVNVRSDGAESTSTGHRIELSQSNQLNYVKACDGLLRPKLPNTISHLALSPVEGGPEKTGSPAMNIPNLHGAFSPDTYTQHQLQSNEHERNLLLTAAERIEECDRKGSNQTKESAEYETRSTNDSFRKSSAKDFSPPSMRTPLLDDSTLSGTLDPHPSMDHGAVGNLANNRGLNQQELGKLPLPHAGQMEWKFTLKDGQGLSLSSGTIGNSELVKELIEQARKYSLKISIHQHIHNHYGHQTDAQTLNSNFPETFSTFKANNTVSSTGGIGAVVSHSQTDFFNGSSEYRTGFGAIDHPTDNDFLSQTPNYNVFGFEPSPQPENSQIATSANFFQKGNSQASPNRSSPNFTAQPGTSSSSGSHSTPGDEIYDMGRHRVSHFNYLPASMKPQLGSSDSTKATDLSKLLNPASGVSHTSKRGKRHRRTAQFEGIHPPLIPQGSTNTSPTDSHSKHTKSSDTPGTASSLNEEEGLDFWESLRSLAGRPSTEDDGATVNPYEEEDCDLFHGLLNSRIGYSDLGSINDGSKPFFKAGKGRNTVLPFNPS